MGVLRRIKALHSPSFPPLSSAMALAGLSPSRQLLSSLLIEQIAETSRQYTVAGATEMNSQNKQNIRNQRQGEEKEERPAE